MGRNKILQVQASSATDARNPTPKGHENVCKARNAKCDGHGTIGHYKTACKKSGYFPQKSFSNPQNSNSTGRMNVAAAVKEPALNADSFDEKGLLKEYQPKTNECSFR